MELIPGRVNHTLPVGSVVMPEGSVPLTGTGCSAIVPLGEISPILFPNNSANHTLWRASTVIPKGKAPGVESLYWVKTWVDSLKLQTELDTSSVNQTSPIVSSTATPQVTMAP